MNRNNSWHINCLNTVISSICSWRTSHQTPQPPKKKSRVASKTSSCLQTPWAISFPVSIFMRKLDKSSSRLTTLNSFSRSSKPKSSSLSPKSKRIDRYCYNTASMPDSAIEPISPCDASKKHMPNPRLIPNFYKWKMRSSGSPLSGKAKRKTHISRSFITKSSAASLVKS